MISDASDLNVNDKKNRSPFIGKGCHYGHSKLKNGKRQEGDFINACVLRGVRI